jgi:hypothetical protein
MNARLNRNIHAVVLIMTMSNSPCSAAALYLFGTVLQPVKKELQKMKHLLLHGVLACAVAFGGTAAFAQSGEGYGMGQGERAVMDNVARCLPTSACRC